MNANRPLRVATYNIHKCRGLDRKTMPERIAEIIRQLDADVVCLQEVVHAPGGSQAFNQAERIAESLGEYAWSFGENRSLHGGAYGNMTLSRLPIVQCKNHDITHKRREERGVLQTDVEMQNGQVLHVFNVHLGTGYIERRYQAQHLLSERVLAQTGRSPRLVLGDFNEWTRGLTTKLLRETFRNVEPVHAFQFRRTFPGLLPLMTLDHIYYETPLELEETMLWRNRMALVASDHLPLVATFRISANKINPP
ncbi:MAG: endonuclease/exonuclease/phosphatase family protein [Acidobacteria bacterium]|nr:endonuclease/exonuclease/phosphatase family protein [Acidobacteriota bacterium]